MVGPLKRTVELDDLSRVVALVNLQQLRPDYLLSDATILDTLYIGDSPTVQAMREYERALTQGEEGEALQKAYDAMDAHEAWNFEARARESLRSSVRPVAREFPRASRAS